MQQEITALQGYFDAWLLLAGEPTRSYYLSALRQYNTFFLFVQNAFFAAFVAAAYKIWDKRGRGDVLTILQFAAEAEKAPGFWNGAEAQMDKLEKDRSQGEKIWRKVGILRNEYFAHLNIDRSPLSAFKKAGVTPNERRSLVELSKQIVNAISYRIDRSSHLFNVTPKFDGIRLLDLLLARPSGSVTSFSGT